MGFIEAPMDEGGEEVLAPEGQYDLRIASYEKGLKSQGAGRSMIRVYIIIESDDDQDYMGINHYLVFPTKEDKEEDPAKFRRMMRNINRFLTVFNIPYDNRGFSDEDLDGSTGRCLVGQREGQKDGQPTGEMYPELRLPRMATD
jgi:hypothetical protein